MVQPAMDGMVDISRLHRASSVPRQVLRAATSMLDGECGRVLNRKNAPSSCRNFMRPRSVLTSVGAD
jgi:hypothetical protein